VLDQWNDHQLSAFNLESLQPACRWAATGFEVARALHTTG
jgi:hypothetical protein